MANILVNSKSLTVADLYDIDEVIAGAKDFAELSELARNYMQNVARALPAYADISGYADQDFNRDTDPFAQQLLASYEDSGGVAVCNTCEIATYGDEILPGDAHIAASSECVSQGHAVSRLYALTSRVVRR